MKYLATPLRIYDNILKQNRYRKQCENDCDDVVIAPNNKILPWQFRRPQNVQPLTEYELFDIDDNLILTLAPDSYIDYFTTAGYDYFLNVGLPLSEILECGKYYVKITTGDCEYFSEIFKVESFSDFTLFDGSLLRNSSMQDNTYWYESSMWTVANGEAVCAATGFTGVLAYTQSDDFALSPPHFTYPIGSKIIVNFKVSSMTAGTLFVNTDYIHGETITANGTYSIELEVYDYYLNFNNSATFDGTVSNVSVTPVSGYSNCEYIKLAWKNTCDLFGIKYTEFGYGNEVFIKTLIGTPEYREELEGHEDGDTNFNATFTKLSKWYNLNTLLIPEFIVDALHAMKHHDSIEIYDPNQAETYEVQQSELEMNWEFFNQCFATMEISWKINDLISDNCCDEIDPEECYECECTVEEIWDSSEALPDADDYEEGDKLLVLNGDNEGNVYEIVDGSWNSPGHTPNFGDVVCVEGAAGTEYYISTHPDEHLQWYEVASLEVTGSSGGVVSIKGYILPGTTGRIIYKPTASPIWIEDDNYYSWWQLLQGIEVDVNDTGDYDFRIEMFSSGCDYGSFPFPDTVEHTVS